MPWYRPDTFSFTGLGDVLVSLLTGEIWLITPQGISLLLNHSDIQRKAIRVNSTIFSEDLNQIWCPTWGIGIKSEKCRRRPEMSLLLWKILTILLTRKLSVVDKTKAIIKQLLKGSTLQVCGALWGPIISQEVFGRLL